MVVMILIYLATGMLGLRMAGRQMRRSMNMWLMRWLKKIWTEVRRIVYFLLGIER